MSLVPPTPATPPAPRSAGDELRLGALLIGLAGAVDAIGFLKLGGLFVSFMSGDSTQAGAALVLHDDARLGLTLALVALFVGGAFVGGLVGWAAGERRRAMLLATLAGLLGAGWLAVHQGMLGFGISLTVLAMGLQNAVLHRAGDVAVGVTYVTGTLARLGDGLARAATGQAGTEAWAPHLLLWLALIAGAAAGSAVYAHFGVDALLAPALVAFILAARAWGREAGRRPSSGGPWEKRR